MSCSIDVELPNEAHIIGNFENGCVLSRIIPLITSFQWLMPFVVKIRAPLSSLIFFIECYTEFCFIKLSRKIYDFCLVGTKGTIKVCNPMWTAVEIETPGMNLLNNVLL